MNCDQGHEKKNTRVKLRFNPKDQFPEKLYDVANDGYLVKWNGCGTGVQVDDPDLFENVRYSIPVAINKTRMRKF
jgi:hypothetical protein